MKRRVATISTFAVLALLVFAFWRKYNNHPPGQWTTISNAPKTEIPWIAFNWHGDTLGNQYFDKAAIFVPGNLEGINDKFQCQLDLGSNVSLFYENPLKNSFSKYPTLRNKLSYYKDHLFRGEQYRCLKNMRLVLGNTVAATPTLLLREQYGDTAIEDVPVIGTIGADLFKDKILIMDFPNHRLCIVDEIPDAYHVNMFDIEINQYGFMIIPVSINGKVYKVMYDSGSSIFSLITSPEHISSFSREKDADTLIINSWGTKKQVVGRSMRDSLALAGRQYGGFNVYSMEGLGSFLADSKIDAMTGNALFWNNVVIFDFKHKKIGIR